MGAFFFLVLEGPLSGDTHPSTLHQINPAVHHQIFFLLFFLQPLFSLPVSYFYLPPSIIFFFLHIGILVFVAMSSNLDSLLQIRLPHPGLPCDVPSAYPWLSQFYIVHDVIINCRSNYPELTPTTPMGAPRPISQLHHMSEWYSFLPQFLVRSSIARINILPYIGAGAHERAQQCAVDTQTHYRERQDSLLTAWAVITSLPHPRITLVPSPVNSCTFTTPLFRNHPNRAVPMC